MSAITVVLGLLEAIGLATTLIEKVSTGEMTPEEAAKEWDATSTRWESAVDSWERTEAQKKEPE